MTRWDNSDYAEADKGRFDAWLLKFNYSDFEYEAIASTYGDIVRLEKSAMEPDFWTCYDIAASQGCDFFYVEEV